MPNVVQDTRPDISAQMRLLKAMQLMPLHDALGVCCSMLLQASYDHPEVVRRLLSERVVREGFSGVSLLTMLQRAAK